MNDKSSSFAALVRSGLMPGLMLCVLALGKRHELPQTSMLFSVCGFQSRRPIRDGRGRRGGCGPLADGFITRRCRKFVGISVRKYFFERTLKRFRAPGYVLRNKVAHQKTRAILKMARVQRLMTGLGNSSAYYCQELISSSSGFPPATPVMVPIIFFGTEEMRMNSPIPTSGNAKAKR